MGQVYTAQFTEVAVTVAQDFFGMKSPTRGLARLLAVFIGQTSDTGDSAEEILHWYIKSGATTIGSGGSDPAAVALGHGGTATVVPAANDTTEASAGTILTHHSGVFNTRVGLEYIPPPEWQVTWQELVAGTATYFEIGLTGNPADSLTMSGTIYWEEEG
ncbi:hypothetical protein LCGC14_0511150 [marine sediment metagenome]|uniref:Uncharacterized protein n=1 Tax=marine sediment metagenome TaxID=412755 RepID=A0A0F9S5Z3_9ZZZZ